ncbi:MAG: thioredoxin family protein [Salinivirgaceae bacterium]|jgi:thiol-disulfide isomerase/thioredoxin
MNVINDIKILCPGRKCGKCRKMIERVEHVASEFGYDIQIDIINTIDEMVNYKTWLLPTLIINDQIVARGYIPEIGIIKKYLKR